MSDVLLSALMLLLIVVLGQTLRRLGVFKADDYRLLSKIVLNITLPAAVINNISSVAVDTGFLVLIPLGMGVNAVLMGVGAWVGRRGDGRERAFHMINMTGQNIGCFAMPFFQTFSGPTAVVAGCFFDAGNAVVAMGVNYGLADAIASGQKRSVGEAAVSFGKKLLSSGPFVTYTLVMSFVLLGFHFPPRVLEFTEIVGAGNVFLSMLMIGISMDLHLTRDMVRTATKILGIRFGLAIAFALAIYQIAAFPPEINRTVMLCTLAPVSSMAVVLTDRCGGNVRLAGTINSCSIVISMVLMTLVASLV